MDSRTTKKCEVITLGYQCYTDIHNVTILYTLRTLNNSGNALYISLDMLIASVTLVSTKYEQTMINNFEILYLYIFCNNVISS